jgi:asparagine synthase (glutamine-hydrolysing)
MLISEELALRLYSTVETFIKNSDQVVIAFSGGVDSSILAKICKDLGKQVYLVTIGFPNSHDLLFSKSISNLLGLRSGHMTFEITPNDMLNNIRYVKTKMSCNNLSHIENCFAFYLVSRVVRDNELSDFFLTANGFDELFCGYDRYRSFYHEGEVAINNYMEEKLANETHMMKEISEVIRELGIRSYQPFLSESFVKYSKNISLDYKIRSSDDLLRKHILRDIALKIGVPQEAALHPKKAIQYGSNIHKFIVKNKDALS